MRLTRILIAAAVSVAMAAAAQATPPATQTAKGFSDDRRRPDGPRGNGWRSAHEDQATWRDPLELRSARPVNIDPDKGPIAYPDRAAGRTAAYRDFGPAYAEQLTIGVWWNSKHQAVGFPIACINLDDADWDLAFCYEPQLFGGRYVLWALGRRPGQIRVVKSAPGPKHADGTAMFLEMRVAGERVTCLADGKEILESAVPKALCGATRHGFGLDVNPVPGRPANVEVIGGPIVIGRLAR